jgi:6-phosphogluconate dehydrogenase
MIGVGRMGANMVQRLLADGHQCVVYDQDKTAQAELVSAGAAPADRLESLIASLESPRVIWIMVPAAAVDDVIGQLDNILEAGDTVIDGGNSNFQDDGLRAEMLAASKINYVDVGTSGGVWGRERGYCLMIGGDKQVVQQLDPLFKSLAPAADRGYLHCGGHGAGHFVKMVHNGIEYGLMAAYAEGFAMLDKAAQTDTAPMLDVNSAEVAEVWRHGSVVGSWLLDLAADALHEDPSLQNFGGEVADSGEGRWFVKTATDLGIPAHVITAALFERFSSRGEATYANRVLSAMRFAFGGHTEDKDGE